MDIIYFHKYIIQKINFYSLRVHKKLGLVGFFKNWSK